MSRTATTAASVGVLAAALAISACSPVMTNRPYAASDGVRVEWSQEADIIGENLMLLAQEPGGEARLLGGLTNSGTEPVSVELGFPEGEATAIDVPAGATVLLNGEGEGDVVLAGVPEGPGATVPMLFATAQQGTVTVEVPVLNGKLEEYASLVP